MSSPQMKHLHRRQVGFAKIDPPSSFQNKATMRKRSRSDHNRILPLGFSEGEVFLQENQFTTSTTIHALLDGSRRHLRRGVLWKLSLFLGIVSSLRTTTASILDPEARYLRDRRLEADRKIRERFLEEDCLNIIVTFASRPGNADPEFGSSDFERTNAKAMRCVSEPFYNSLFDSDEVLLVELDVKIAPASITPVIVNNERVPWGATAILEDSWDAIPDPQTANANPISICIVDSGLLVEHPDIPYAKGGPNIMGAVFDLPAEVTWDVPVFYAYHGTHLAGTMIAEGYNAEGLRGIIPRNAGFNLLIARVFGNEMLSSALTSTIERAVEWCADNGANVINLSLASDDSTVNSAQIYRQLVQNENILVVAASGNRGNTDVSYPAGYDHVISVGSIDSDMSRSSFSQYGSTLDLVAPGRDIYSTVPSSGVIDNELSRLDAGPMAFTPIPNDLIEGDIEDCGLGDIVCSNAMGKVCLMEHTPNMVDFPTQAWNCENGGGIGLILYPSRGGDDLGDAVMDLGYSGSISVVTVSRDSGLRLLEKRGTHASISFSVPSYRTVSGTSMSAAHVSGLIAKLWAARPSCTNTQIRQALEATAFDLGAPGRDDEFGHGLVQGVAAYNYLLNEPPPCGERGGSGFDPNGGEAVAGNPDRPVTERKTPRLGREKPRICNRRAHPFCGEERETETARRGRYLRHGRDSQTADGH